MSKATFMVVHPDGTYQTRTTTRGRVYTGAIVKVEQVTDVIEAYRDGLRKHNERADWDSGTWRATSGWYEEKINTYRSMLDQGVRYLYGKAEYRSDMDAAHAEASSRNAKDAQAEVRGRTWGVYLVHPVPEGTKKSEYADLAKSIAEQWAVPF